MHDLMDSQSAANRPVFRFEGSTDLPDAVTASAIPQGQLSLSGPNTKLDAVHWPVRGDLAHIALAGKVFVPHYAVPMPRAVVAAGASLNASGRTDGEALGDLAGGTLFNVLDIAGGWAWGQVGDDGMVGYLPVDALEAA